MKTASIGSVSTGTLKSGELIETFLAKLWELDHPRWMDMCSEYDSILSTTNDLYDLLRLVSDCCAALNECAPPYSFFGSRGRGDDEIHRFGFWHAADVVECHYDDHLYAADRYNTACRDFVIFGESR